MNELGEDTLMYTNKDANIPMTEYKNDIINTLKDDRDFFDHAQSRYKRIFVQAFLHQVDQYLDTMQRTGGIDDFIDIGCGKGFITNHIQEYIDTKGGGVGIDISPAKIHFAQSIFPDTKFMLQDTQEREKNEDMFDLVVCTEVLEHLDHPEDMIAVCKNLSKKYVLISVPHEPYFSMASLVMGKNISRRGTTPAHKQKYNKNSLSKFLHTHLSGREITISARGFRLLAYCKKNTTP